MTSACTISPENETTFAYRMADYQDYAASLGFCPVCIAMPSDCDVKLAVMCNKYVYGMNLELAVCVANIRFLTTATDELDAVKQCISPYLASLIEGKEEIICLSHDQIEDVVECIYDIRYDGLLETPEVTTEGTAPDRTAQNTPQENCTKMQNLYITRCREEGGVAVECFEESEEQYDRCIDLLL
ncbi:hypothetical protein KKG38_05390 [Patescibacteria group bacterium]|nr:hypothetical protein [Patescibacteria group bacterium]MBU1901139.1 hypothetical protein [Patescibacteria group bacterium]